MNRFKRLVRTTTIMDFIPLILGVVVTVGCWVYIEMLENGFAGITAFINGINSESVTAGYEVLGGVMGYLGLGLIGIALGLIMVFAIGLAVWMITPVISGFICLGKFKKAFYLGDVRKSVRNDSIIKIVFNGLLCALIIWTMIDSRESLFTLLGMLVYPGIVTGISAYTLVELNKE